jgi:transcription initiation factor TFIIF subunit alpha
VTKYALEKGLHYHALRLRSKDDRIVDPYDAAQFQRPIKLHRRMARDKMETAEQSDAASGVDDKERELLSIKRAERQAEREANQALIAPTGGDSKKAVRKKPQKKVEDVYFDENNPAHRQRAQLRYEEARPWHLEDFEGKNVWVGSYEEPLSDSSVMFEIGSDGFRMVPVEKWYKFSQTNRFSVMDSDAVEKHMGQKFKAPRWFMGTQTANDEARKQATLIKREQQRARSRGYDDDDDNMQMNREEYQADVDEIDFEFNDEFQDDDEGLVFADQDDDAKEIEKRIRDEMRTANLPATGIKDEDKDWDDEEKREKKKEKDAKRQGRRMRKQLMKKEKKNEYDSDSDTNEFSEVSSSEDSEEERDRLEEERRQEEARKQNGDKSGASTKGTNTPTGRSEKRDQGRLGASLKRPGSPDLSEMSGNESTRKKAKGINGRAVSSAPNGARSLSRMSLSCYS